MDIKPFIQLELSKGRYLRATLNDDLIAEHHTLMNDLETDLQLPPTPETQEEYHAFLEEVMIRKARYEALCSHLSEEIRRDLIETYHRSLDLMILRVKEELFAKGFSK